MKVIPPCDRSSPWPGHHASLPTKRARHNRDGGNRNRGWARRSEPRSFSGCVPAEFAKQLSIASPEFFDAQVYQQVRWDLYFA
jgi:hypothetical protein